MSSSSLTSYEEEQQKIRQEKFQKVRDLLEYEKITFEDLFPSEASDLKKFYALKASGVENWEWYEDALENYCSAEEGC
jgi:hypothetical protein